mgnify:FL=1
MASMIGTGQGANGGGSSSRSSSSSSISNSIGSGSGRVGLLGGPAGTAASAHEMQGKFTRDVKSAVTQLAGSFAEAIRSAKVRGEITSD